MWGKAILPVPTRPQIFSDRYRHQSKQSLDAIVIVKELLMRETPAAQTSATVRC